MSSAGALAYTCLNRTVPCLSTIITARLAVPRSSLYTPYSCDTCPLGWKSASTGYGMLPRDAANAVCVGFGSVLMPRTWASDPSKSEFATRNEETWCVQPPVNEKT